ncbi:MAG: hypothetical protein Crog4KO_21270 [Crocinitomicaceae bacterium]
MSIFAGCKEPPALDILIVDDKTGEPVEGADVYIKKKLVATSDENGIASIATTDRRKVYLSVEKANYFDWKFTVDNLAMTDEIRLKPKYDPSKAYGGNSTAKHNYQDAEYTHFLEQLSKVDTASLPKGCDYLDGIYSRDATFPGGQTGLMSYIQMNVQYPEEAIDYDEQGKVYLSFVVASEGTVHSVKVERGVSKSLDREAKRVVRSMPNWNPAYCNGRPVSTRCRLPIVFTLN